MVIDIEKLKKQKGIVEIVEKSDEYEVKIESNKYIDDVFKIVKS